MIDRHAYDFMTKDKNTKVCLKNESIKFLPFYKIKKTDCFVICRIYNRF